VGSELARVRERVTVLVAMAANAAIAIVKAIAGVLTGSAALLAEAAHSFADTANQVLLLTSLELGRRPADEEHPFGHGKDRFFWSFLAAVVIFLAGAVFSIGQGVLELVRRQEEGSFGIAYATLAFAFVAESISLARAVVQTRGDAARRNLSFFAYVRRTTEPAAKTVLYEDTVAVTGVLVAALGIALHQLTGNVAWDAAAAIVVGVILVYVAVTLGRNFRALLIGAGAPPDERERLREVLCGHEEVTDVLDLRTMYVGPGALLVAARIDLAPGIESERVEELSSQLDRELRDAVGDVRQVFLDPTSRNGSASRLGGRRGGSGIVTDNRREGEHPDGR
jgi:cation diffusion facilitator family transporter